MKMRLNVTYRESDVFPCKIDLKEDDVLSHCFRTCFQLNQDGMILNGTHQLLVYADDVSILVGKVHTIKKNTENLLVSSEEMEVEVNVNKTKFKAMFHYQSAKLYQNKKADNISFERVKQFKHRGTTLTYKISIEEEIKSRMNSGNTCYHSV
jgi:hypothetical protein